MHHLRARVALGRATHFLVFDRHRISPNHSCDLLPAIVCIGISAACRTTLSARSHSSPVSRCIFAVNSLAFRHSPACMRLILDQEGQIAVPSVKSMQLQSSVLFQAVTVILGANR